MPPSRDGWELPSFWLGELAPIEERAALASSIHADVVIVGGGLSGLWTAFYLTEWDSSLRVVVVEREITGYGASGRNGGWVSALFPVGWSTIGERFGAERAVQFSRALVDTVDEVGRRIREQEIACDFAKVGAISAFRNVPQAKRAAGEVDEHRGLGLAGSVSLLDADSADDHLHISHTLGATFTPDCASVQPARLVRGLAAVCEARGVTILERSPVTEIHPGSVVVGPYSIKADTVVIAAEAYASSRALVHRQVLPLYSMMVVTEPLSDEQFERIGSPVLGLCFADHRNLVIYGQITHDRRIAFGGRGAPYHVGSSIRVGYDTHAPTREGLERELIRLFPALVGIRFVRHWGGPLGVSRDWFPRVSIDPSTRIARLGGYAGDGVAATNLAARVLAGVIVGRDEEPVAREIFGLPDRGWEPEPLRWLGINAGLALTRIVDAREDAGLSTIWLDRLRRQLIGQG
ncbi:MAG: NAD(P)/FAD-dependent oxidoreductase [Ferrimicrobium sp.]